MQKFDEIKKYAQSVMSDKRFAHTMGVAEEAEKLARVWGADPEKAYLAGLIHDIAKELPKEKVDRLLEEAGETERFKEPSEAVALHGFLAAYIARKELGISDEEVLDAAKYHTTGRLGMTLLEKIIYVADFTEVGRKYPQSKEVRELARENLDEAVLKEADYVIKFIIDSGRILCTSTVEVRNSFLNCNGVAW